MKSTVKLMITQGIARLKLLTYRIALSGVLSASILLYCAQDAYSDATSHVEFRQIDAEAVILERLGLSPRRTGTYKCP